MSALEQSLDEAGETIADLRAEVARLEQRLHAEHLAALNYRTERDAAHGEVARLQAEKCRAVQVTATARTVALLDAIDGECLQQRAEWEAYRIESWSGACGDAVIDLTECLRHIVRAHPGIAQMAETYAARAAKRLGVES